MNDLRFRIGFLSVPVPILDQYRIGVRWEEPTNLGVSPVAAAVLCRPIARRRRIRKGAVLGIATEALYQSL